MAKGQGQGVVLGYLKYVLGFDSLAFEQGLGDADKRLKAAQKSLDKTASKFGDMGVKLSAALTAPLVAFATKGIAEARETEAALAQVNAAISSMGNAAGRSTDQLTALADKLELSSLYEGDQILREVTANLLTFGNVAGQNFDRAQQAAVDLATRMQVDLQSATLQIGKALNDPIKGLTSLSRAGIQFTEAQKAQIKALVASGQAAQAQTIILGELERQFGGAAAAAQNVDPLNRLTDAFNQMAEKVGAAVLPLLPPLTNALVSVLSAFTSLSPETQKWVLIVGAAAAAIGPVLVGIAAMVSGFGALLPIITAIGPAFIAVNTALVALTPLVWGGVKALAAMALTPVGAVITGIAVAVGAVYLAWKNWDKIEPILRNLYNGVKTWLVDKLGWVFDGVKKGIDTIKNSFYTLYDAVVGHSYIPDMVDGIAAQMARLQTVMVDPATKASQKTSDIFRALAGQTATLFDRLFPDAAKLRQYQAELETINQALKANLITAQQADEARKRLAYEVGANDNEGETITDPLADLKSVELGDIAKDMDTTFFDPIKDRTAQAVEHFSGMARDILGSLRGMVQSFKGGDIIGGLQGLLDLIMQVTGIIRGTGTPAASVNSIGNYSGPRAEGGPVSRGRTYLVGEQGPEMFTATRSGYIHPNKGGGGQRPIMITVVGEEGASFVPRVTSISGAQSAEQLGRASRRQAIRGRNRLA